jgi:hexosaminidase
MRFFFFLILFFLNKNAYLQHCPILPSPVVYNQGNENIYFDNSLYCDFIGLNSNLSFQLQELAKVYHDLSITSFSAGPKVIFKKLQNVIQDSYSIQVSDQIVISYSSDASCYYAMNSLMQLIRKEGNEFKLNRCYVKDYPKFSWRGLHLDVARHFFTVEEVKRYIDLMSYYKFNTFHWHLTDDQGWRIEIKQYPKLTEVGAWRDSTLNNHYSTTPRTYSKEKYGGFYTQDQVKEIVSYAQSKYVTVVPEIEMPGHSRAALAAYPEFGCTGKQMGVEGLWGVFDDIFCSKSETISFLKNILDEIVLLFPGEYIHIGGDEAPKIRWKKCAKCQDVIINNNLTDEHHLQSYFIQEIDAYLTKKGKKIIGWDEILEGGLSSNSAVMSWRGFDGGIEAANQEHYVVMSPGSHCYFDHYQSKSKDEPLAIGGYTPLEKVYDFNPIPKELDPRFHPFILGAQANLWTEYISSFKQVEYMVYPRAIALSQVLWNPDTKPVLTVFEEIISNYHFPILLNQDVNFSKSIFIPRQNWFAQKNGIEVSFDSKKQEDLFHVIFDQEMKINNTASKEIILRNNQSFHIDRGLKSSTLNFSVHSEQFGTELKFSITRHLALGSKINFITKPSEQYNNGELLLVDGQFGNRPWKGNEWIGFDTNNIIIELELKRKQKIKEIQLSFLLDIGSWIHTPVSIDVTSNNSKTIKIREERCGLPGQYSPSSEKWKIPFSTRTNKLRISIHSLGQIPSGFPGEGNIPWTFIDEIQVIR